MIADKLISLLKNDTELKTLIEGIEPYNIEGAKEAIVYSLTPLTDDNIKRTDRLEIHIISKTVSGANAIDAVVRKLLLTAADAPLMDGVQKVQINGGGTMEDIATGTKHLITYYYVVSNGGLRNGY